MRTTRRSGRKQRHIIGTIHQVDPGQRDPSFTRQESQQETAVQTGRGR